jgi:hypothetical protein
MATPISPTTMKNSTKPAKIEPPPGACTHPKERRKGNVMGGETCNDCGAYSMAGTNFSVPPKPQATASADDTGEVEAEAGEEEGEAGEEAEAEAPPPPAAKPAKASAKA